MDIEELRRICLSLKACTEDFPFDETTLCFRVGNKIFAITDTENIPLRVNLKCDPERAIELRELHEEIVPGYHCNKKHWNTIYLNGNLDKKLIVDLIQHSYNLIFNSLAKKIKESI